MRRSGKEKPAPVGDLLTSALCFSKRQRNKGGEMSERLKMRATHGVLACLNV